MKNQHKKPSKATGFTLEFKQAAAKLVNEKGCTHQQAADSLGISLSAIGRWVRAERGAATVLTTPKSVTDFSGQAELVRLRKDNDRLRMGREILKKAAGIEAKEAECNMGSFGSNRRPAPLPRCVASCR
ncbi:transposase [Methyloglobulus sp.]|uniref:transposase n=1 Tax=Methyloglobulus sp. TaxID=2518622 RepID=UPI0032B7BAB8